MRRPILSALLAVATFAPGMALSAPEPAATEATAPVKNPAFAVKVTGSGPPLLFIPGLMCSGDVWREVVAHYSPKYECHVFTLAGFAGQPPLAQTDQFLPVMRDAVAAYVKEKGLKNPVIVGHSLGGVLAMELASTAPDAFAGAVSVDGFPFLPAAMNPTATAESMKVMAEGMRLGMEKQTPEEYAAQARQTLTMMAKPGPRVSEAQAWAEASDRATVARAFSEVMTTDLRPKLAASRSPILLIAAADFAKGPMRDQVEATLKGQLAAAPRHQLVLADNARHFIMFDDLPFLLNTLDGFLAEVNTP